MRCVGCGRLTGLKPPIDCPCWRSVHRGATIPYRIKGYHSRVRIAFEMAARAETEQERANAQAVADSVNGGLRTSGAIEHDETLR